MTLKKIVTLFRAKDVNHATNLGLPGLAAGGMDVVYVSGDRVNMLYEPHVLGLANKLKSCIDKAEIQHIESSDRKDGTIV